MTIDGEGVEGRIELRLLPTLSVHWTAYGGRRPLPGTSVKIEFRAAVGTTEVDAQCSFRGDASAGWIPHLEGGREQGALDHVVAHWLNPPRTGSSDPIHCEDTGWTPDRWTFLVHGWRVAIDPRSDLEEVLRKRKDTGTSVLTHVMETRRADRSTFSVADVEPVLDGLRLGLSFGLGRWVAPVLPVGFDRAGARVWEEWSPLLCAAGQPGSFRWWAPGRVGEMEDLLASLIRARSVRRFSVRFIIASAVLSASGGFVEQRIMMSFAALEHLAWHRLVVVGSLAKKDFNSSRKWPVHRKLAALLHEAGIPTDLPSHLLPALHGAREWLPSDVPRTGPGIISYIRNKIVHPTDPEEQLYGRTGDVVTEAWFLAHDYLVLLILHEAGYRGCYRKNLASGGFVGDVVAVPWASGEATPVTGGRGRTPSQRAW